MQETPEVIQSDPGAAEDPLGKVIPLKSNYQPAHWAVGKNKKIDEGKCEEQVDLPPALNLYEKTGPYSVLFVSLQVKSPLAVPFAVSISVRTQG